MTNPLNWYLNYWLATSGIELILSANNFSIDFAVLCSIEISHSCDKELVFYVRRQIFLQDWSILVQVKSSCKYFEKYIAAVAYASQNSYGTTVRFNRYCIYLVAAVWWEHVNFDCQLQCSFHHRIWCYATVVLTRLCISCKTFCKTDLKSICIIKKKWWSLIFTILLQKKR